MTQATARSISEVSKRKAKEVRGKVMPRLFRAYKAIHDMVQP